jgi:flagellar motility protein MotE (MotC chaperone)
MTGMLKLLSIAVVLFGLAAGVSWYLQSRQVYEIDPQPNAEEKTTKARSAAKKSDAAPLRSLIRPPSSHEADRITQMAAALQQQQESLKAREQHLTVREKQIGLIHDEIKKEQNKLDAVRKEIQIERAVVQEKLDLLEKRAVDGDRERQKAEAQKEEIRRAMLEVNSLESKNLKHVAAIYEKMDSEAAAQSIQQMIDQGKLDMAVTIVANMRERQAASVLGELFKQDASMAGQLFERMRLMKSPTIAPK